MKSKQITMILNDFDVHYIKYALEQRIKIWNKTASYFRDETVEGEIEEANSEYEAKTMIQAYTNSLNKVISQEAQNKRSTVSIIQDRISYWKDELDDVKSEIKDVKSIREEDAEWILSEYDWILEQLSITKTQ